MSKTEELNANHLEKCLCNFCMSKWIFSIGDVLKNDDGEAITILAMGLRLPRGRAFLLYSEHNASNSIRLLDFEDMYKVIHSISNIDSFAGSYNYWAADMVKDHYKLVTK